MAAMGTGPGQGGCQYQSSGSSRSDKKSKTKYIDRPVNDAQTTYVQTLSDRPGFKNNVTTKPGKILFPVAEVKSR